MLSYRHSFHAGNFADILKHIVAVEVLEHLTKKDKPFEYIDTHSGAGLFNFKSAHARKLEEHSGGIGKLKEAEYPELSRYFKVIRSYNEAGKSNIYPGSPLFAKYFLRHTIVPGCLNYTLKIFNTFALIPAASARLK